MAHSAVSGTTSGWEWDLPSHNSDDWLVFKNELNNNINDTSLKLTKHEIAEQVLHDIEDLGRNDTHDWLDYSPLFGEIQTLPPVEEVNIEAKQKFGNYNIKWDFEQPSPNDVLVVPEIHEQPSVSRDLFSVSYEEAATFILSDEDVLYVNNQPLVALTPFQVEQLQAIECDTENSSSKQPAEKSSDENEQPDFCSDLEIPNVTMEMEMVDELIRNTALELDQWESDASRSEVSSLGSSPGSSPSNLSPKRGIDEGGEGTDDPDWEPYSFKVSERKRMKRPKPYCRGENQEKKKLRKKEQNRMAASRYRQKLRAEGKAIKKEEELLKDKKGKLEEKVADIQNEIKSIKSLMRDFFIAKGMIK